MNRAMIIKKVQESTLWLDISSDISHTLFTLSLSHVYQEHSLIDWLDILARLGMLVYSQQDEVVVSDNQKYIHRIWRGRWETTPRGDVAVVLTSLADAWLRGIYVKDPFLACVWDFEGNLSHVRIVRALCSYIRQVDRTLYMTSIEHAVLMASSHIAQALALFMKRHTIKEHALDPMWLNIESQVRKSLSDDNARIVLMLISAMKATLRTNIVSAGLEQPCIFKIKSQDVLCMVSPYPWVEVFIYHEEYEGVHMRMGPKSRGGLRWSDRLIDYRTEALALASTQQLKNAIIVPSGAKGTFVLKQRDQLWMNPSSEDVTRIYRSYIRSLLAMMDNVDGSPVMAIVGVCYDDSDSYLVVAADKGTAQLVDSANQESIEHGFWLGDAFASGGKNGFDHKALGITSRGAWVSLSWYLHLLGMQSQVTRWVGIGSMVGDVFGNGLLVSDRIMLIAAFDNKHIFIDPSPDIKKSFEERKRLYALPHASWADYDMSQASEGAAVYSRFVHDITLSDKAMEVLAITTRTISPDALIMKILSADVDVLWSGGIGTYIKSSHESHEEVQDSMNDTCRVDADKIAATCIIEGANVSITRLGRREFSQLGGLINTDFIDNSAGVDCSDHEVNLKILLAHIALDEPQRIAWLKDISHDMVPYILAHNIDHNHVLSAMTYGVDKGFVWGDVESTWLKALWPVSDYLNTAWYLRPDACWLLAIVHMTLRDELVMDAHFTGYHQDFLREGFPDVVREKVSIEDMERHPLARQIMISSWAHRMLTDLGPMTLLAMLHVLRWSWSDMAIAYAEVYDWACAVDYYTHKKLYIQQCAPQDIPRVLSQHHDIWSVYVYGVIQSSRHQRGGSEHDKRHLSQDRISDTQYVMTSWADMWGIGEVAVGALEHLFSHKILSIRDYAMRLEIAHTIIQYAQTHALHAEWMELYVKICKEYPRMDVFDIYFVLKNATL